MRKHLPPHIHPIKRFLRLPTPSQQLIVEIRAANYMGLRMDA